MKVILSVIFILLLSFNSYAQERHTISGYVSDEDGEMLIGVNVYVPNTTYGGVSNTYGFYSLTIPEGSYTLIYSFVGFEAREIPVRLDKNIKQNVTLKPVSSEIQEVQITAERKDKNIQEIGMGNVTLQAKTIKKIPNLMGETDIIKSIQLLPGVQTSVEGSSGFYVRGGNADQNLVLLDGATVYNPSHLFGFFSVFNGDAIKNVELYKGGIPAEYGGRLSSVLDVRMKEGNTHKIHGNAGIGLISSRLTVEGPLYKDKVSFLISARRTYADLMLPFATDTIAKDSKFFFYDLNAKVNFTINENNRIFVSGYFGRDVNRFADFFQMNFGNATGTIRWNHAYSGRIFSNLTLIYSDFDYEIGVPQGTMGFKWLSHIVDRGLKNDYTFYINSNNTLDFGLHLIYHTIRPGVNEQIGEESYINSIAYPDVHGIESAIFISNEQKIGPWVSVQYGLRYSLFQNVGPATIYGYDSNYEVNDTLLYGKGNVFNTFGNAEPRLGIRVLLGDKSSIKAGYNRMAQYLHLASNSTATFPLDMWFMSSPNVKPQLADQVALGYFRNFYDNTFETSIEVFYKKLTNSIDFKDHAQLIPNTYLEGELRIGTTRSYGVEFMVRKESGKLNGWISYAYIHTRRHIPEINRGDEFPPPYDKPNNVSVVIQYEISKRFDAAVNWVYSSANPVTVPAKGYYYGNIWIPNYSKRGGVRIPETAYHRLDFSFNWNFRISRLESNLNLSVYNVYNRHNAFAVYFRDKNLGWDQENNAAEGSDIEVVKLYLFPIIPTLTFNVKF
ncbi:MAG: TonB-dependent receptor [Bacteroidales bacterium]|nr:TonB-dependent receptor [Bacteroidales bacterium]MBN2764562.1 TonB-dependent receptor [Bacteroidales bacterium]